MKKSLYSVEKNEALAGDVYLMTLNGDTSEIKTPGQFVNISLDGFYLRRPISVCDVENGKLTLIYKVVGRGTEYMSKLSEGFTLDVLTGLGNGYDLEKIADRPLLIGGGAGVPPMYLLAKRLIASGKKPKVILGFNSVYDVFFEKEFNNLDVPVYITTVDGTYGIKGFVTDAMKFCGTFNYTCSCGPEPMLKAVYEASDAGGQFSFEERMGCGFGACMGCSCKTKYGSKRICKEGPVLEKGEIVW